MPLRISRNRVALDGVPLNEGKSADVASAATIDIWAGTGNLVPITGTATISAFAAAPQAGAKRTLLCISTPAFTHGASFLLPGSLDYTATAGDRIEVLAITTTQFRLSILKASVLADVSLATDASGNKVLVGADGNSLIPYIATDETWAILGDSLTANNNVATTISLGNATRSGNVVTVTLTSHNFNTNQEIILATPLGSTFDGMAIVNRTGVNTFTFAQTGSDEVSAVALSTLKFGLVSSKSWFQNANRLSGGKMRLLYNGGSSGQRTAAILARVDTVIDYSPSWVTVLAGINDINSDLSAATITSNLDAIYSQLLGAGIKVVAMTLTPYNSTFGGYYSVARNQVLLAVNSWIRRRVASSPNVVLADLYSSFIDNTSVNGYGVASYYVASDSLHIGANGAVVAGTVLWNAISANYIASSPLVSGPADNTHAVTASSTANENVFSGGWAAAGTTATGTGMSCDAAQATTCRDPAWLLSTAGGGAQTAVAKIVARSDGKGYDQQMVLTATVSGDNFTVRSNYNATASGTLLVLGELVPQGEYEIVFDVNLTGVAGQNVDFLQAYMQMSCTYDVAGTSTAVNSIIPLGLYYGAAGDALANDITGPLRSVRFTLPNFTAIALLGVYFFVQFSGAGTATLKAGRGSIRRVG